MPASRPTRRRPLPRPAENPPEPSPEARAAAEARLAHEERVVLIRRLKVLAGIFCLFVVAVLAQLVLAQVLQRPTAVAADERADTSRGRIVDRDGALLATDAFTYEVWVDPRRYNAEKWPPAEVAPIIGTSVETLQNALQQEKNTQLTRTATMEQCADADKSKRVPTAIWCDERRYRAYPLRSIGAHLVGFANRDQVGLAGAEGFYDEWLRTAGEWPSDMISGPGEPIPSDWGLYLPSPGGRDLVLHMSAPLQYAAEKRLLEALAKYEAKGGSIIIMEARTGGILAMANWPTFDLNIYDQAEPASWQNPSVGLHYEPGSIFKVVTYAAAIDVGAIKPDDQFNDTGEYQVGDQIIRNSQKRKLGWVTGWDALAESLNTVSADICLKMGSEAFYRYVRLFGFGKPTEIDLKPEAPGLVRRYGTERWSQYDQAANSFGQGISTTPLQMINAVAAIANDGALIQPQVARALALDGKMRALPVRKLEQAIQPETARTLTRMMTYTVDNYEIGKKLVPGFKVAGKTGTAEIPEQAGYTNPLTITSFVGFLPAADPKIVVLVKLDEPKKSRWAEMVALPVFGDVARDAVQILGLTPNSEMP